MPCGIWMATRSYDLGDFMCMGALTVIQDWSFILFVATTKNRALWSQSSWQEWKSMVGPVVAGGTMGERTMV